MIAYTCRMKKSLLITVSVLTFLLGETVFLHFKTPAEPKIPTSKPRQQSEPEMGKPERAVLPSAAEEKTIPFIAHAPGGKWDNPIFRDGCEEASMLMVMGWIRDTICRTTDGTVTGIGSRNRRLFSGMRPAIALP